MKSKSGISPLLYLSAGLGLLAFVLLVDRIHPFKAAPFAIDRHQAIAVADQYLQTAGFSTEGFRISAMVREPVANFQYLQSQVGLDSAVLIARDQHSSAFSANWFIFYYQNLRPARRSKNSRWTLRRRARYAGLHTSYPPSWIACRQPTPT